ncbi:MAG: hypothetical protein U0326_14085 [Polyangiales bacterium]
MLRSLRRALLLVLASSCVEQVPPEPTCTDGRSRCVSQVSLGAGFGCALLNDRTVWCWGRNDESQLGYATTDLCPEELASGQTRSVACHTFPFQVTGLDHVVRVATGSSFACAQRDDGTVRCWGANGAGQLGNGLTLPSPTPVAVRGLTGATALAAGARRAARSRWAACGAGAPTTGTARARASARPCSMAEGAVACESQPVQVEGLENVISVTAGAAHTCARRRGLRDLLGRRELRSARRRLRERRPVAGARRGALRRAPAGGAAPTCRRARSTPARETRTAPCGAGVATTTASSDRPLQKAFPNAARVRAGRRPRWSPRSSDARPTRVKRPRRRRRRRRERRLRRRARADASDARADVTRDAPLDARLDAADASDADTTDATVEDVADDAADVEDVAPVDAVAPPSMVPAPSPRAGPSRAPCSTTGPCAAGATTPTDSSGTDAGSESRSAP